jgi:hypothetical protein
MTNRLADGGLLPSAQANGRRLHKITQFGMSAQQRFYALPQRDIVAAGLRQVRRAFFLGQLMSRAEDGHVPTGVGIHAIMPGP